MLELLDGPRALRVRGEGRGVVHLDLDGSVVTVAAPGVPRMPNAIVARAPAPPFAVAWDPATRRPGTRSCPPSPAASPRCGRSRRGSPAGCGARRHLAGAGERLLGRGPGLTPEGDDLLGGAAVAVRALGPAAGLAPEAIERLVRALCPADARDRTGASRRPCSRWRPGARPPSRCTGCSAGGIPRPPSPICGAWGPRPGRRSRKGSASRPGIWCRRPAEATQDRGRSAALRYRAGPPSDDPTPHHAGPRRRARRARPSDPLRRSR